MKKKILRQPRGAKVISDKTFQEVCIEEVTSIISQKQGKKHYEKGCARQLVQRRALQAEGD